MSELDIELHLPWPPTVNHYYTHTKNGVYISSKGNKYRKLVQEYVFEQTNTELNLKEKLMVIIVLYPPDRRTRDIDNYNKSLLDALTNCNLWEDDSLIDQLIVFKGSVIPKGKVNLFIQNAGIIIPATNPRLVKNFI